MIDSLAGDQIIIVGSRALKYKSVNIVTDVHVGAGIKNLCILKAVVALIDGESC